MDSQPAERKRGSEGGEISPAKKVQKLGDDHAVDPHALKTFKGFVVSKVLKQNLSTKLIVLLGKFSSCSSAAENRQENTPEIRGGPDDTTADEGTDEKQAVVLLEKTAFRNDNLPVLLSENSSLTQQLQNDIYGTYECFPPKEISGIKTTVIYPATAKHIQKYSVQDLHLINETPDDYQNITLPFIQEKQFNIQWVFNILEKKAEAERIVYEDPDPETGFVMLPDMKWDGKQTSDLYLVVIVHRRGIKSLRDLDDSHLPLLRNIQEKCLKCIKEKYNIPAEEVRAYLHYQPSYYHLHVHFTHLKFDAPGTGVTRAHLLSSVIENIELVPDYYRRKPLAFILRENDGLLGRFREARSIKAF